MKQSRTTNALFIACLCMAASHGGATNLGAHSEAQFDTTTFLQSSERFSVGTFTGDDIRLKLDSQGKYILSGGAVDTPIRGRWTIERMGSHTLLRLTSSKKENDWLFGLRTNDILQLVDEKKLFILDRTLNIYEDTGILTRDK